MPRLIINHEDVSVNFDIKEVTSPAGLYCFEIQSQWKDPKEKDQEFNKTQLFLDRNQLASIGLFLQDVVKDIDKS
jgi:hypothetical protein